MSAPTAPTAPTATLGTAGRWAIPFVVLVLVLPIVVVSGNLRKVPVVGGWFGPPRLVPTTPVDVGLDVTKVTAGDGAVWLLRSSDHRLLRADRPAGSGIRVPDATREVVAGGGPLWLFTAGDLLSVDPKTGRVGEPVELDAPDGDFTSFSPDEMVWGAGSLWVLDDTKLLSVGREGTVTHRVVLPLDQASARVRLLAQGDAAWVVTERRYDVVVIRVDAASGRAEQVLELPGMSLQSFDTGAATLAGIWFAANDKKTNHAYAIEIDARDATPTKRRAESEWCPSDMRAGGGQIWWRCGAALEHLSGSQEVDAKADVQPEGFTLTDWAVDDDGVAWFVIHDGADQSVLRHMPPSR